MGFVVLIWAMLHLVGYFFGLYKAIVGCYSGNMLDAIFGLSLMNYFGPLELKMKEKKQFDLDIL